MQEPKIRQAACSCGQLQVTCRGEPVRVSVCHCLACQRRTGSPFAQQARWPVEWTRIEGVSTLYRRVGESGGVLTFHFCPTCGSTVYYQIDQQPEVIAIPVGAFADPTFPAPAFSVYETRKHGWVQVPNEVEHFD